MPSVNLLHFTDFHQSTKGHEIIWQDIESEFYKDLENAHGRCGPFDLILFTGDLVQKGEKDEFLKLNENLKRISGQLDQIDPVPLLIPVPGNHDLKRPDPKLPEMLFFREWPKHKNIQADFWDDSESLSQSHQKCF